ncbi:DUF5392 family protein [Priestia endophytica]|uniref:Uncharacterized protein n=1 Tax=Priestia endophytica DSM 13796 TaxID=1121089 RepID=A0A1I6C0D2_9BACI|nr:DUF5392 family protein [Priestia endophytica]KYG33438.1 hypothetical protein AZF06_21575 [Priestia endophytica]SFQ86636.1 hypothetical protein SAMN02745910_04687 [Priestia endophytica DSM 13796]
MLRKKDLDDTLSPIVGLIKALPDLTEKEAKKYRDELDAMIESNGEGLKQKAKLEKIASFAWFTVAFTVGFQPLYSLFISYPWNYIIPGIFLCFALACTVEGFRKVRELNKKRIEYMVSRIQCSESLSENRKQNFIGLVQDKKEDSYIEFGRFIIEEIIARRSDNEDR